MCQINFTIQYTDANGDMLQAAEGRYKLQSSSTWNTFTIDLLNPQTPDVTTLGNYDLEVRVQDVNGAWSNWFPSIFTISDNCTGN